MQAPKLPWGLSRLKSVSLLLLVGEKRYISPSVSATLPDATLFNILQCLLGVFNQVPHSLIKLPKYE